MAHNRRPRRTGRPYWEENGFTTEWGYHRYQMRLEPRMPLSELARIIDRHGEVARKELIIHRANSPWYAERTAGMLAELAPLDLFDGLAREEVRGNANQN